MVATSAAETARDRSAGILLFLGGMALFTANDAIGKWLVADYTVAQVLLLRSVAALVILLPWIVRDRRALANPRQKGLHLLRLALLCGEVACFYWALRFLPLADVMTIYMSSSIFVTALAGPVLGERVGPRRWAAVVVGFCGVIIVLNPSGAALSLPALVALGGTLAFSVLLLITRRLRAASPVGLVTYQNLAVGLVGGAAAPFYWVPPTTLDFVLLLGLGVVSLGAHVMLNRALAWTPAAVVAPFQYSSIVLAAILGYLVWGDVLSERMLLGNLIIIGSGLYIWHRERSLAAAGRRAA
jgi:drug/metabolite transporter (DMT)-like permease